MVSDAVPTEDGKAVLFAWIATAFATGIAAGGV